MQQRRTVQAGALRAAFVVEQTLGHVTHGQNLSAVLGEQDRVMPTWLPVAFDVDGVQRVIPVLRSNWSVRASWRARRALDQALRRDRHDALFFHTQVTSLFSVDLMRRFPTVLSLDATPLNYDRVGAAYGHKAAGDGFLDRRKFELNRRAFLAATTLVTWSEWTRRSLIDDYGVDGGRIDVLAPGAAQAYFDIGQHRAREPRTTTRDRLRVLFVGGDFDRKGGPQLLEVVRSLGERCELHIVTRQAVPAAPGIFVHNNIGPNSPALLKLFREADVFVLPSLGECLAVVLMEATAAGLPIITTAVGALSEAVLPGESGLVVQPGDARDLRAALEHILVHDTARTRMGMVGHQFARRKFNARANNGRLLDLIADAVRTRDVPGKRPDGQAL